MTLTEVTELLNWVSEHRIDQYVKIDVLTDKILDLLETQPLPEPEAISAD